MPARVHDIVAIDAAHPEAHHARATAPQWAFLRRRLRAVRARLHADVRRARRHQPYLWLLLLDRRIRRALRDAIPAHADLLLGPLRPAKAPELSSLMVTLGATLLLYSLMTAWFTTDIRRFPPAVFNGGAFEIEGLRITLSQILIVVTVAIIVGGLAFLLQRTKLGLAIRALAENGDTAQLMGVNAGGIVRLVSFISGALGGAAGVLIGLNYNAIQPYMGEMMMLKGFAVIILGGLGDIRGAVLAGLILGILETLTAGYVASSMKDAVGFLLLVLTLWLCPVGLFGRVVAKRA